MGLFVFVFNTSGSAYLRTPFWEFLGTRASELYIVLLTYTFIVITIITNDD